MKPFIFLAAILFVIQTKASIVPFTGAFYANDNLVVFNPDNVKVSRGKKGTLKFLLRNSEHKLRFVLIVDDETHHFHIETKDKAADYNGLTECSLNGLINSYDGKEISVYFFGWFVDKEGNKISIRNGEINEVTIR